MKIASHVWVPNRFRFSILLLDDWKKKRKFIEQKRKIKGTKDYSSTAFHSWMHKKGIGKTVYGVLRNKEKLLQTLLIQVI